MEIEIIEQRENKLIGRVEIKFRVKHPGAPTPTREEVRKKLSAMLGKPMECVILRKVVSVFGKPESIGIVHVYSSKEEALKWEPKYILIRNKLIEGEK